MVEMNIFRIAQYRLRCSVAQPRMVLRRSRAFIVSNAYSKSFRWGGDKSKRYWSPA